MKVCEKGCIVRSEMGRDRKRLYLVTEECPEEDRVFIADGKLHRMSAPKKKNRRHLAVLAAAKDAETSILCGTDEELYKSLQGFEDAYKGKTEA